ncbi:MAG: DUF2760 domain-containing protein [Caldilineaceae bacterium]|nr:DUF2760 domain-containing protein [Caldilineaceae bacterium]
MNQGRNFAILSLITTLIINGLLLALVFYTAADALFANGQYDLMMWGGLGLTLLLWLVNWLVGRGAINSAAAEAAAVRATAPSVPAAAAKPAPPAPKPKPEPPAQRPEEVAVQLLSILQREGRLIDFLNEDLSQYQDDQIGAAVRTIQEGSKKALLAHVKLEPVYDQAEGTNITVGRGFDANTVRLVGNVVGDPPFQGVLRHRGWRVTKVDLPQQLATTNKTLVITPAEVEV